VAVKILHVPYTYYPATCGGTEVYVATLMRELQDRGISSVIAAVGEKAETYDHGGFLIHRFPAHHALTQGMMFGGGDPLAAEGFERILEKENPDLVHFHAFTPAVSQLCLKACEQRGIPCVSTYHTPTVSCLRGDLMRWGHEACDGRLDVSRCGACFLHRHGMPRSLAGLAVRASRITSSAARIPGLPNSARAVLSAATLTKARQQATRAWWNGAARVVALCEWTRKLLLLNGVPDHKIVTIRHGLPTQSGEKQKAESEELKWEGPKPIRLAFLGRLDPTKGIDLILGALRELRDLQVTLDVYAIAPERGSNAVMELKRLAETDARVTLRSPVPPQAVVSTLTGYDALLVPSRWMETGPLVVLEAFAAGIPVVGSNLGGIAEWVQHEINGLLIPESTTAAWASALARLSLDRSLLPKLQSGINPPRSMGDIAQEMARVYEQVLIEKAESKKLKTKI
jgi:glycosyltransferase involved in cell wall biosynthesis